MNKQHRERERERDYAAAAFGRATKVKRQHHHDPEKRRFVSTAAILWKNARIIKKKKRRPFIWYRTYRQCCCSLHHGYVLLQTKNRVLLQTALSRIITIIIIRLIARVYSRIQLGITIIMGQLGPVGMHITLAYTVSYSLHCIERTAQSTILSIQLHPAEDFD